MEIIQQESRVVIVHLLKVRNSPLRVSGVPEESSADLVIDAAMGHRIQTRDRDLQRGKVLFHKMPGQGEFDRAWCGKLWAGPESAVEPVKLPSHIGRDRLNKVFRETPLLDGFFPGALQGFRQSASAGEHVRPPRSIDFSHFRQERLEPWPTTSVLWWEVGASIKDLTIWCEKGRQRPAASARQRLDSLLVPAVDIRPRVSVYFDGDEMLIHQTGDLFVLIRFHIHDVTPVAPHRADIQEDGFIFFAGLAKRRVTPGTPVYRLLGGLP